MKTLIVTLIFALSCVLRAEFAVIDDKDGFTNVRAQGSIKGKVVTKVMEGEVFSYEDLGKKWVNISVVKNEKSVSGFMHSSCIKPIEKLPKYQGKDLKIKYTTRPFKKEGRNLQYDDDYLTRIDGREVFGSDGTEPRVEIAAVTIKLKGKALKVSPELYKNLFEPSSEFTIYQNGEFFYIHSYNSDGGGGYELVWIIDAKGNVTRRAIHIG